MADRCCVVTPASHVSLPFSIHPVPIDVHPLLSGSQGQTLHITDVELRQDDQVITVAVQTMPIRDEQGTITYAIAGFQDISDRRAIETALKQSETRFRAIAANVPGAILRYVLHPDGTDSVPYISPSCEYLWEVDADAMK